MGAGGKESPGKFHGVVLMYEVLQRNSLGAEETPLAVGVGRLADQRPFHPGPSQGDGSYCIQPKCCEGLERSRVKAFLEEEQCVELSAGGVYVASVCMLSVLQDV